MTRWISIRKEKSWWARAQRMRELKNWCDNAENIAVSCRGATQTENFNFYPKAKGTPERFFLSCEVKWLDTGVNTIFF